MNKRAKLLMTLSVVAVLAGSGTALAATNLQEAPQAEQAVEQQQEKAPFHKIGDHKMFKFPLASVLHDYLGVTEEELRTARQEGKTLVQIAADKGISEDQLIEHIVSEHQKQLDQLLADGKITQEQADKMKEHFTKEQVKEMVNGTGGFLMKGKGEGFGAGGKMMVKLPLQSGLLEFLGVTEEELRTARQEGKTLVQIAADKGISEDQLIEHIVSEHQKQLDQLLADGKITQEQADKMKEHFTKEHVKEMINGQGPKKFKHIAPKGATAPEAVPEA
jgi:uncharacterized protein YidB (DUF937 family)